MTHNGDYLIIIITSLVVTSKGFFRTWVTECFGQNAPFVHPHRYGVIGIVNIFITGYGEGEILTWIKKKSGDPYSLFFRMSISQEILIMSKEFTIILFFFILFAFPNLSVYFMISYVRKYLSQTQWWFNKGEDRLNRRFPIGSHS